MTSKKNYSGIAVNQRLSEAGLLTEFFNAANKKDRDDMISILLSIEYEQAQAEEVSDAILGISDSHGF